jgi:hypothetical protein
MPALRTRPCGLNSLIQIIVLKPKENAIDSSLATFAQNLAKGLLLVLMNYQSTIELIQCKGEN